MQTSFEKSIHRKLLAPIITIVVPFILLVSMLDSNVSKTTVIGLLIGLVVTQWLVGLWSIQHYLQSRLARLHQYLQLVVNTEKAPEAPLKDHQTDELATITNDLSQFIEGLKVVTNGMSTQVFGEYDFALTTIMKEMKIFLITHDDHNNNLQYYYY